MDICLEGHLKIKDKEEMRESKEEGMVKERDKKD